MSDSRRSFGHQWRLTKVAYRALIQQNLQNVSPIERFNEAAEKTSHATLSAQPVPYQASEPVNSQQ